MSSPQSGCTRVGATQPMIFSADETTDIGYESVPPITPRAAAVSRARSTGYRSTSAATITTLHRPRRTPPHRYGQLAAPRILASLRAGYAPPRAKRCFGGLALFDMSISASFLGDGRHSGLFSVRRGGCSGEGAAADNPHVTTVEPEVLTPAGRRWVERAQRPLDVLAVIFLIDVILLWSFPDAPPAFVNTLNVIAWIVWACFAVDYVARLLLSFGKARFVRTHKLDLLMVLLPMLRLLRIFLLLRHSLASVSTERIAGSIVSIVVVAVFVSAFFMWRVEYDAPGATITTFRDALWWAVVTTTTVGYGDYTPVTAAGRVIGTVVMIVGVGLIGTVSATVASWFVTRHSEPVTEPADVVSVDIAPAAATTADTQAPLLDRLDELGAKQDEIRAMLIELQRPPTSS